MLFQRAFRMFCLSSQKLRITSQILLTISRTYGIVLFSIDPCDGRRSVVSSVLQRPHCSDGIYDKEKRIFIDHSGHGVCHRKERTTRSGGRQPSTVSSLPRGSRCSDRKHDKECALKRIFIWEEADEIYYATHEIYFGGFYCYFYRRSVGLSPAFCFFCIRRYLLPAGLQSRSPKI